LTKRTGFLLSGLSSPLRWGSFFLRPAALISILSPLGSRGSTRRCAGLDDLRDAYAYRGRRPVRAQGNAGDRSRELRLSGPAIAGLCHTSGRTRDLYESLCPERLKCVLRRTPGAQRCWGRFASFAGPPLSRRGPRLIAALAQERTLAATRLGGIPVTKRGCLPQGRQVGISTSVTFFADLEFPEIRLAYDGFVLGVHPLIVVRNAAGGR
jgi:hypothetical protein